MKKILTDIDGVVLDWQEHFHKWMQYQGYERANDDTSYDIHITYDVERPAIKALIKQFNESAWIGHLNPFRDSVEGIAAMVMDGYTFEAITSLSSDKYAGIARHQNLINYFGKETFSDVICLGVGADKDEALAPYKDSGLWWIEDKWENAVVGAGLGLKTIIMDHSHNQGRHHPDIIRASNWSEIREIILDSERS